MKKFKDVKDYLSRGIVVYENHKRVMTLSTLLRLNNEKYDDHDIVYIGPDDDNQEMVIDLSKPKDKSDA